MKKIIFANLIVVAFLLLNGCASTNKITAVPDTFIPTGAKVGYISIDKYCPPEAFACMYLTQIYADNTAAIEAFQNARSLDLVLIENLQADSNKGLRIGMGIAKWTVGLAIPGAGIGMRNWGSTLDGTKVSIGTYNHGIGNYDHGDSKANYTCDDTPQCRAEAARLMSKSTPGVKGEQISI